MVLTRAARRAQQKGGLRNRQPSQEDLDEHNTMANHNVNWVGPWFYFWYIFGISLFRWCMYLLPKTVCDNPTAWTATSVVHCLIMFMSLHWVKGTPTEMNDQDHYRNYTWWEQLDGGVHWTNNRKMFFLVPIVLFFLVNHGTAYDLTHLGVNTLALLFQLVPKLPSMHKVRVLDIND